MRKKCPNCCPDFRVPFVAFHDADGKLTWECDHCGHSMPRRIKVLPTGDAPLTKAQIQAITKIQLNRLGDGKELKAFRVSNEGTFASVSIVVGLKSDEGTMASILCRDRGHFFVRRGGKIEAVDPTDENRAKARKHPLIYGWRH